ncbi:hypothetical protein [Poseidonibacter ostreae]|uniref:Uncharacterized protein n=1 Tax=Poseidonibacter ostreae TaxID=2654171 RepID=A0A6L4WWJ0_9BACT|nr:hypothetical protein [Poseidonibacter ostreae]KAB7891251.1 hypothetical protein GBG19_00010 [Poseidonibacter ostreae]
MNITLKVSQKNNGNVNKPLEIYTPLFGAEVKDCGFISTTEELSNAICSYQKTLQKEFPKEEYYQLDNAHSQFDTCMDFDYSNVVKNHCISIPLTLFLIYTDEQLRDISNHLFVQLSDKWISFYKEGEKLEKEK